MECSALSQVGLRELFQEAVRMVLKNKTGSNRKSGNSGTGTKRIDEGSSCKCHIF